MWKVKSGVDKGLTRNLTSQQIKVTEPQIKFSHIIYQRPASGVTPLETSNLNWLIERPENYKICFMAEYFLPDINNLKMHECKFEMRFLTRENFAELYVPEWRNALCEKRKVLDVPGVRAYDGGKLIGLSGCSADCEKMWQIGVDVLPEYRSNGIASALTSALAIEIINRGKAPFYCAAWSNIRSVRNAIKSGFRPAWTEMTVKPANAVDEMNEEN